MKSSGKQTYLESLDTIIKNRNVQINQVLSQSGTLLSAQAIEADSRVKGKKGESEAGKGDGSVGVLSMIQTNLSGMVEYYEWGQHQAKIICWVAVSACIVGLLVIAAAVTFSALKLFTMEKEILTAVGGMITAIFGGTTLLVYRSSVKQLTYFHKSLHEDQRFLSAVDLLWRFSNETDRDKMLAAIIRNSLKINLAVALQQETPEEENKTDKKDDEEDNGNGNNTTDPPATPPATPPAKDPAKPPKK